MLNKKTKKICLALFISGGATTACAIINACNSQELNIIPALVIASKKEVSGIENVIRAGMKKKDVIIVDHRQFKNAAVFADKLIGECEKRGVNLIGQYGWMPVTPIKFINRFKNRIINQHPGPLDTGKPDFGGKGMYGRRVHCAVLHFRRATNHDLWTEATAHFTTEKYDEGAIIKAIRIPIENSDTVESLQRKVLPMEHKVQIQALKDFAGGKTYTVKRDRRLIQNSELNQLTNSKQIAQLLYPFG